MESMLSSPWIIVRIGYYQKERSVLVLVLAKLPSPRFIELHERDTPGVTDPAYNGSRRWQHRYSSINFHFSPEEQARAMPFLGTRSPLFLVFLCAARAPILQIIVRPSVARIKRQLCDDRCSLSWLFSQQKGFASWKVSGSRSEVLLFWTSGASKCWLRAEAHENISRATKSFSKNDLFLISFY